MARQEEEHLHNYLEDYLTDAFADRHLLTPILFDWGRVCKVEPHEELPFLCKDLAEDMRRRGMRFIKVHVSCPNPEHGDFNTVMNDPPVERDLWCDRCIDEEIDRIIRLRAKRDWAWIRENRRGS